MLKLNGISITCPWLQTRYSNRLILIYQVLVKLNQYEGIKGFALEEIVAIKYDFVAGYSLYVVANSSNKI